MSRFPIIYQREQEDCGAACLAMITRFYGFQATLEAIKAFCSNTKNGMTMYGLNCAAKRMGFFTQAVRMNWEELNGLQDESFPLIVHWNQNHFIVVYKRSTRYIYVADPALGRIKYIQKEFVDGFASSDNKDGFALLLKPDNIVISCDKKVEQEGLRIRDYIKPHWQQLTCAVFSLVVLSLIGLTFPFLTQAVVDKGIAEKKPDILITILCATLSLAVGRTLFSFLQSRMTLIAATLIDIDLANDLLMRLSSLPMKFFAARKVGDIIQRVSDVSRIGNYFSSRIAESSLSTIMFVIYGGILLHLYPLLFAVFISGAILYVCYILLFLRKRKILDYESFLASSKSHEELIQYLRGMTELKLADAEDERLKIWRKFRLELFEVSRRSLMLSQKQELGSVFLFQVVDAIVVYLMAKAVINGSATLGAMMAVQYIIGSMENPLHVVTGFIRETQSMRLALSRVNYIASSEPERVGGEKLNSIASPSIQVRNLCFSYDIDAIRPALNDVNAFIPAGKTTALVGMSGSGKTTFMKLLLGFYTPDEGNIYVGNHELSETDLMTWRKNIGSVMQDSYLFSDTIINNVALGDEHPSVARIKEALHIACADFVFDLPIGMNTKIGVEGMSLSSGQRQRILLARAIYKRPTVFMLDEATNALDTINERQIYKNLSNALVGKTVIIAAHRLSTISNADQILVFDNGKIVEKGTHTELLMLNGKYSELVKNQRFN